jgi:hypothetical protein
MRGPKRENGARVLGEFRPIDVRHKPLIPSGDPDNREEFAVRPTHHRVLRRQFATAAQCEVTPPTIHISCFPRTSL